MARTATGRTARRTGLNPKPPKKCPRGMIGEPGDCHWPKPPKADVPKIKIKPEIFIPKFKPNFNPGIGGGGRGGNMGGGGLRGGGGMMMKKF